jgi:hypothetical protein
MPLMLLGFLFNNWKWVLLAGAIAGAAGWLAWERHELIGQGVQQEIQTMEKANAQEDARATAGAEAVDLCYKSGGDWDRADGVCTHAASK